MSGSVVYKRRYCGESELWECWYVCWSVWALHAVSCVRQAAVAEVRERERESFMAMLKPQREGCFQVRCIRLLSFFVPVHFPQLLKEPAEHTHTHTYTYSLWNVLYFIINEIQIVATGNLLQGVTSALRCPSNSLLNQWYLNLCVGIHLNFTINELMNLITLTDHALHHKPEF